MKSTLDIKKEATAALAGRWGKAILILACVFLMSLVLSFYPQVFPNLSRPMTLLADFLITALILQPFQMGSMIFLIKLVRKEEISLGLIFDGYSYVKKLLPLSILFFVFSIWGQQFMDQILLQLEEGQRVLPSLAWYLSANLLVNILFSQVHFILYDHPEWSGLLAIGRGVILIAKHWIRYISLQLSFLLWILVAAFTGGILLIWLLPYIETANTVFYEEIKESIRKKGASL